MEKKKNEQQQKIKPQRRNQRNSKGGTFYKKLGLVS